MSGRRRAVGFAAAAALCAGLAASATGARPVGLEEQFGELRQVLVSSAPLRPDGRLTARRVAESVEVRRVPLSFLPPGVLSEPEQLVGRRLVGELPAGSYLTAALLAAPESGSRRRDPRLGDAESPVEIAVTGAAALAEGAGAGPRSVDVVVTSEPGPAGAGRTYVAAEAVELLGLRAAGAGESGDPLLEPAGSQIATLALTRSEALRLIQAESFARSLRLIAR